MATSAPLVARPGALLRGASIFGLLAWLGIFCLLFTVPGITAGTYLSALAMASLFLILLLGQAASEIRAHEQGLAGRTFFRKIRCGWDGVRRLEVRPFLPGVTIFLVATNRGPLVFTSLWRNHQQLVGVLRERGELG